MTKITLAIVASLLLIFPAMAAKKKPHVIVQKPTQITHPLAVAAFVAPPLLVFYDLNRRINCLEPPDPLGLGGPGFDGKPTPPTNVMISCWERRYNAAKAR